MSTPFQAGPGKHHGGGVKREIFRTRAGFILAAVGSAVGLGNMWRFPYVAAEGGGAAFVLVYIILTLAVGIPLMLSEFSVGRGSRLAPIGALRKLGGGGWSLLGIMYVATGFLILSYYSVIAGWVVRYALDGILAGFPEAPGARFEEVSSGWVPVGFQVAVMVTTVLIVMAGVRKGIERAALVLMPVLFGILILLAIWALTLPGAVEGYAFYLRPSISELLDPYILSQAAGQAFYSLSLGMGCMLTFSSYLSDDVNMNREAAVISFSDFGVAFIAGLVVFPVIFALGLQGDVSESTVGALFIALPGAFVEMGAAGRVVGILFFVALIVGAVTSAVSLLEVVTASLIDEYKFPRKVAAVGSGILITALGLLPATSLDVLSLVDKLSEAMLALGAFFMAIFVGWVTVGAADELRKGASERFQRLVPGLMTTIRFVLPPVILFAAVYAFMAVWRTYLESFGG
ncbi:sodium-dependent transporter [Gemmatimonadota bacterium]